VVATPLGRITFIQDDVGPGTRCGVGEIRGNPQRAQLLDGGLAFRFDPLARGGEACRIRRRARSRPSRADSAWTGSAARGTPR
jgi:hypothetical protein